MLIASAQVKSSAVPEENMAKAEAIIMTAARRNAKLVVFPEVFMAWIAPDEFKPEIARARSQPLDGHFVHGLGLAARNANVWVIAGVLETASATEERTYNTTVVFDDKGNLVTSYRKTHMFDAFGYRESEI